MEPTVVAGIDRATYLPYVATLNGSGRPVDLPAVLADQFPPAGAAVTAGPVSPEVSFTRDDPVSVFTWLLGYTDVTSITGPYLGVEITGDVRHGLADGGGSGG